VWKLFTDLYVHALISPRCAHCKGLARA
jgi:hypothetical protein